MWAVACLLPLPCVRAAQTCPPVACLLARPPTCLLPAETLALRWRQHLTAHLHRRYCQHQHAFYSLQQPQQGLVKLQQPGLVGQEQAEEEQQQPQEVLDNPDQRIAADAAALCESLSVVARVAAAAPFKLCYYRWGGPGAAQRHGTAGRLTASA